MPSIDQQRRFRATSQRPRTHISHTGAWVLSVFLCCLWLPGKASAQELTVFAAASLGDTLQSVFSAWKEDTGNTAVASYAGSSALARQIQQGAPADLFISASRDWMDAVEASADIRPDSRRDLLGNRLVLIAHGSNAEQLALEPGVDLAGLLGDERLAMAMVDAVPAGIYGKAALTALGIWDSVEAQVAQSDNVRSTLNLVASGEAPYGIVYATDARAEPRVSVVATFDEASHEPIVYPVAILRDSRNPLADDFLAFLSSERARALFEADGFTVLD